MKLYFNGLELEADYTPAEKGTKDKFGQRIEPDTPAEIDFTDIEIICGKTLIEYLYENFYYELLNQATGIVKGLKHEVEAEKLRNC